MTVLAPQFRVQVEHRSPVLVDLRAGDLFLPDGSPAIEHDAWTARSGQVLTLTRAGVAHVDTFGAATASGDPGVGVAEIPKAHHRVTYLGGNPYILIEKAATNLCLQSETLDNASWTASNITVTANDALSPRGDSTAELLVASAANGTLIQDLGVLGSDDYTFSIYLRRKTGTGNVELTLDNGATWTNVSIPTGFFGWARYWINQTLANPDVGIRLVTSGDEVWAWGAQAEVANGTSGAYPTSYISTVGSTVARVVDVASMPFAVTEGPIAIYLKFIELGTLYGADLGGLFHLGAATDTTDPRIQIYKKTGANVYRVTHDNGTSTQDVDASGSPTVESVVELLVKSPGATGDLTIEQSINGAASTTGTASPDVAHLEQTWGGGANLLYLGSTGSDDQGVNAFAEMRISLDTSITMDQMRLVA